MVIRKGFSFIFYIVCIQFIFPENKFGDQWKEGEISF